MHDLYLQNLAENKMLKLLVCIKQVPMVTELPWDAKNGTLKRELAEGMMNTACKHALEAALQIKEERGAYITTITMGPPMAEGVAREALAMGADKGVLLTDKDMAGSDTFGTSFVLARIIEHVCPDFDLILCGTQTSDSETAQVGPQLAEELDVPGVCSVEHLEFNRRTLRTVRLSDNYLEILEFDLPGLITVSTQQFAPRYVELKGLEDAFNKGDVAILDGHSIGLDADCISANRSFTNIQDVYSPIASKKNVVLKGSAKKIVEHFLSRYEDKLSGAIGKDLKAQEKIR